MADTPIAPPVGAISCAPLSPQLAGGLVVPPAAQLASTGNPAALISGAITVMGWSLADGDIGAPTPLQRAMQAVFTCAGTYGTGGALTLEGSADGAAWTMLGSITDDGTYAAGAPSKVGEFVVLPTDDGRLMIAVTDQTEGAPTKYFRPAATGDGTTALNVTAQLANGAI